MMNLGQYQVISDKLHKNTNMSEEQIDVFMQLAQELELEEFEKEVDWDEIAAMLN